MAGMQYVVSLADAGKYRGAWGLFYRPLGVFRGALDAGPSWLADLGRRGNGGDAELSFVKYIF